MLNEAHKSRVLEIFEHLHAHPEISWEEHQTTRYVQNFLEEQGLKTTLFDDCTGVMAEFGSGGPIVGIRSDLDALWQEVDGCFRANHSCGHDGHMSIAMGVLLALKNRKDLPPGTLRFIFQPAEEKGTGALKLMEKGVLQDLSWLFGVHLRPIQEVPAHRASCNIYHGASCFMSGIILGEDAHGARPHKGVNAIEVGAQMVQMLAAIRLNPAQSWSVKMTRFQAGGKSANIIPGKAEFFLDLRAQNNEIMMLLRQKVAGVVSALSSLYEIPIEAVVQSETVAARPDAHAEAVLARAIAEVLGPENQLPPVVTPGGEDFHYYTVKCPELKGAMLGLGCDLSPGLHHPQMTFRRESLYDGIEILARAAVFALESEVS